MGHDNHHGHEKVNPHATQETDAEIVQRIRPIELIKHNPNVFHVSPFDLTQALQIAGGAGFEASVFAGAGFGWWYYSQKARLNPASFYANIALSFSRIFLGAVIGGWVGYLKFGDRQRLHNAWVAERLRRRYPDTLTLTTKDIWRFKGVKAAQEYYRWT